MDPERIFNSNEKSSQKFYPEIIFTKNIKIFLQLYIIKTNLLTCRQDLVRGGCH